jgi:hypothetical protein
MCFCKEALLHKAGLERTLLQQVFGTMEWDHQAKEMYQLWKRVVMKLSSLIIAPMLWLLSHYHKHRGVRSAVRFPSRYLETGATKYALLQAAVQISIQEGVLPIRNQDNVYLHVARRWKTKLLHASAVQELVYVQNAWLASIWSTMAQSVRALWKATFQKELGQ